MRRLFLFNAAGLVLAALCAFPVEAACVRHPLRITIDPLEATITPASSGAFIVKVQNRDTRGCDDVTAFGVNCGFDNTQGIQGYDPATTYCAIDPSPGVTLRPAQKKRLRIDVHVGAGTAGVFDVTATALRDGRFNNEDRATVTIGR